MVNGMSAIRFLSELSLGRRQPWFNASSRVLSSHSVLSSRATSSHRDRRWIAWLMLLMSGGQALDGDLA